MSRVMNKVYIVLYNGNVSSEGYDTVGKAIYFIENRYGNPKQSDVKWEWIDSEDNQYLIEEINIR